MNVVAEFVLVVLVLTDLAVLATSRLTTCVRLVAVQGAVLGLLPLVLRWPTFDLPIGTLAVSALALKGIVFPWLLLRTMRLVEIRREAEPYIGYTLSMVVGVLLVAVSAYLSTQWLPVSAGNAERFFLVGALAMILTGMLVVVSRRKAISQVLGFLMLENGVYAFGVVFLRETSLLVELAILLDVFVAVLVMGVAVHRIQRGFEHIDVDQLSALKG